VNHKRLHPRAVVQGVRRLHGQDWLLRKWLLGCRAALIRRLWASDRCGMRLMGLTSALCDAGGRSTNVERRARNASLRTEGLAKIRRPMAPLGCTAKNRTEPKSCQDLRSGRRGHASPERQTLAPLTLMAPMYHTRHNDGPPEKNIHSDRRPRAVSLMARSYVETKRKYTGEDACTDPTHRHQSQRSRWLCTIYGDMAGGLYNPMQGYVQKPRVLTLSAGAMKTSCGLDDGYPRRGGDIRAAYQSTSADTELRETKEQRQLPELSRLDAMPTRSPLVPYDRSAVQYDRLSDGPGRGFDRRMLPKKDETPCF